MAQTPLSVRLLDVNKTTTRPSAAFRTVVLSMLLVIGSIFTGCGSGGDGRDMSSSAGSGGDGSTVPSGPASASLAWDPVGGALGYIIHYGTESPGSVGSCAYTQSAFSSTPTATVTGLSENTTYYFAVSAYNGLESACSAEVSTATGSA